MTLNWFPRRRRTTPREVREPLARARRWLLDHSNEEGVYHTSGNRVVYREVTGYTLPTLLALGERDRARGWAERLVEAQAPDGSMLGVDGKPYVFDTAQVMRGWLCCADMPSCRSALDRAASYLLAAQQEDGTFPDPYAGKIPTSIFLYCLEPWREAGLRLERPEVVAAAERALVAYAAAFEPTRFDHNAHFFAYAVEALLDLGRGEQAAAAAAHVKPLIRRDGALPAAEGVRWVSLPGHVQFAGIFYKLGDLETGDRLLDWMVDHQNPSGGFYGARGRGTHYFVDDEPCWAVKFFIDTVLLRIRRHFELEFPAGMDRRAVEDDFRLKALRDALAVRPGDRVLEVGCGDGRFLRALQAGEGGASYHGLDLSAELAAAVGKGIEGRAGDMMQLPYPDASFDVVYSVEALEHAPEYPAALREMFRVLAPGGRFAVIDKNRACLGSLALMPWEQWFDPGAVLEALRPFSGDARQRALPDPSHPERGDRFVLWHGTREGSPA